MCVTMVNSTHLLLNGCVNEEIIGVVNLYATSDA